MNIILVLIACCVILTNATAKEEIFPESIQSSQSQTLQQRIANATVSEQIPFMVSMRQRWYEYGGQIMFGNGHVCGAVLITYKHALVAASCARRFAIDVDISQHIFIAGSRFRYWDEGRNIYNFTSADEVFIHPNYNPNTMINNIAVIKLSSYSALPVDDPKISPIHISNITIPVGSKCQIFGWGLPLSLHGSHEMLKGDITIVENDLCGNPENSICAGPDHVYPCAGDDGSPVVCNNVIYGLVGYRHSSDCDPPRHRYTSYVNTADYYDWIIEQVTPDGAGQIFSSVFSILFNIFIIKFLS